MAGKEGLSPRRRRKGGEDGPCRDVLLGFAFGALVSFSCGSLSRLGAHGPMTPGGHAMSAALSRGTSAVDDYKDGFGKKHGGLHAACAPEQSCVALLVR